MAETNKKLRYPLPGDNPDIAQDIKNLALDVDDLLDSYVTDAENTTYSLSVATDGSGVKVTLSDSNTSNIDDFFKIVPSSDLTVTFATLNGVDTITIGVNGELSALAGLTSAIDTLPYFTGSGIAGTTTLTSFGRSLIDDADSATARTTLGLGTMATANTSDYLTTSTASTTYAPLAGAIFTGDITLGASRVLVFEGSNDDTHETTLTVTNPTEDRTIALPNASGTIALTSDLNSYATTSSLSDYVAKSIVDAKGDLIVGTTDNTVSRLAVSATNGHVLTVDSSTGTGLKWAAPSGGAVSTLSDVQINTLTLGTGQVLKYDGTKWVNGEDISGTGGSSGNAFTIIQGTNGSTVSPEITTDTLAFAVTGGGLTIVAGEVSTVDTLTFELDSDLKGIASATLTSAGFLKTDGSGTYSVIEDKSSEWNTAYADRLKWDGTSSATTFNMLTSTVTTLNIGSNSTATTVAGSLTVSGDLTVNGTTTTINSTVVTVDDRIFILGGDTAPTSDDNLDRGIEFRWHNGTSAKLGFFGYDDSTGFFTFIPDATDTSGVISGTKGALDINIAGGGANRIVYNTAANVTGFISAPATSDTYLKWTGSAYEWATISSTGFSNPMTTLGDLIVGGASGAATRLAGNTATQPAFLTSTGTGSANTSTSFTSSTGSGNVVLATSPSISTSLTTSSTSFSLLDTTATTVFFARAATSMSIGATTGTTQIRNLMLPSTTSTADGRIAFDYTYKHAYIGDGTATLMLVPTFKVQSTAKTGAYTINLSSDANTLIQMNGAFAFTVPADTAAPVGTQIHLVALTTGVTILGATAGVLINGAARNVTGLGLRAAYSSATLIKLANDNWLLVGDLSV